jgi:MFS family permease
MNRLFERGVQRLGGRAHAKAIFTLACVIGLDSADKGAIGAMSLRLQSAFHIGRTEIGLLVTASSLVMALATLPYGWLVDRISRARLLHITIILWGVVMAITATATSYLYLVAARAALGLVIAAATPAVASLVGDYFDPDRRGKIYGYVLSGELIGAGAGYLMAGEFALISWRAGFASLAAVAFVVAWLVKRLPEPPRGGSGRLQQGQRRIDESFQRQSGDDQQASADSGMRRIRERVEQAGVQPDEKLVLDESPEKKSLWWAIGYVLRIRSNLILIIADAMGYFLFSGMRIFGIEYMNERFAIGHTAAIIVLGGICAGMLLGVLIGGRLGDRLIDRGRLNGRVMVAISGYLLAGAFLVPGLITANLALAFAPLFLAFVSLGSANPPVDAARLDIMHPLLWGRAESVRMTFRLVGEAIAPLLFGYFSGQVFGGGVRGLQDTFLVMLIPLFAGGLIALIALRTYPRDVATADAYSRRTLGKHGES